MHLLTMRISFSLSLFFKLLIHALKEQAAPLLHNATAYGLKYFTQWLCQMFLLGNSKARLSVNSLPWHLPLLLYMFNNRPPARHVCQPEQIGLRKQHPHKRGNLHGSLSNTTEMGWEGTWLEAVLHKDHAQVCFCLLSWNHFGPQMPVL